MLGTLWKKSGMAHEDVQKDKKKWVRVDIDPVIYDADANDETKKEGAAYTYNKKFGFAAIFAHLAGGWMVNADLYPGNTSFHGPETIAFVNQSLGLADRMTGATKLLVMDCGLEDQEMLANLYDRPNTDFILKHNKRRESSQKWLELARDTGELIREDKEKGFRVYRGSAHRRLKDRKDEVRLVFEVKEFYKEKGQLMLFPRVEIVVYGQALPSLQTRKFCVFTGCGEPASSSMPSSRPRWIWSGCLRASSG